MFIETGSTEYILMAVTGPAGMNPWDYPGEAALIPVAQAENGGPLESDWKAGNWVPVPGGRKELALLYTPGLVPPGEYIAYGRVTAAPEKPLVKSGRVQIGN